MSVYHSATDVNQGVLELLLIAISGHSGSGARALGLTEMAAWESNDQDRCAKPKQTWKKGRPMPASRYEGTHLGDVGLSVFSKLASQLSDTQERFDILAIDGKHKFRGTR